MGCFRLGQNPTFIMLDEYEPILGNMVSHSLGFNKIMSVFIFLENQRAV